MFRLGRKRRSSAERTTLLDVPTEVAVQTSEPRRLRLFRRLGLLISARQILGNLVRKEIKVKYKSSVLGAAWSMLNPILYLAVFSFVFGVVLRNNIPDFPIYLLSGLLAWNLFSTSLSLGARSVVDNGNLVTKVYFPREILPLASVGAALFDFLLQGLVLGAFMVIARHSIAGLDLLLLPLSLAALLAFTSALCLWVASLNVRYRDTQHLLNLALLTWFWVTPVVYPSGFVYHRLLGNELWGIPMFNVMLANPIADIVMGFQRALYGTVSPLLKDGTSVQVLPPVSVGWLALLLTGVLAGSLILLFMAWRTFFHLSGDFAEEL